MGSDYEKKIRVFLARDSFNVNCSRRLSGSLRHYFRLGEQELGEDVSDGALILLVVIKGVWQSRNLQSQIRYLVSLRRLRRSFGSTSFY
jgi:hypothetical protein